VNEGEGLGQPLLCWKNNQIGRDRW